MQFKRLEMHPKTERRDGFGEKKQERKKGKGKKGLGKKEKWNERKKR